MSDVKAALTTKGRTEVVPSQPSGRPAMALARRQKTSRSMLISGLDQDPSRSEEPRWASSPHAINELCPGCCSRPERRVREPGADTVRGNAFDEAAAGCLRGGKEAAYYVLCTNAHTGVCRQPPAARRVCLLHQYIWLALGPPKIGAAVRLCTVLANLELGGLLGRVGSSVFPAA